MLDPNVHKKLDGSLNALLQAIDDGSLSSHVVKRAERIIQRYEADGSPDQLSHKLVRTGWRAFWLTHQGVASAWFHNLHPNDAGPSHPARLMAEALRAVFVEMVRLVVEDGDNLQPLRDAARLYLSRRNQNVSRSDDPRWDGRRLWLGDQPVKAVRSDATNCREVLDLFEKDGWPETVTSPLDDDRTHKRLGDAVRRLNQGQEKILFRRDGAGRVSWCKPDKKA
jgi:hypothetical protein